MLNVKSEAALVDADSMVILSSSNWFKELRSNRYHYATRFARTFPVLFVQADLNYKGYQFESTEFDAIKVLHVWKCYDNQQINLLNSALLEVGANQPIFWIYHSRFDKFLACWDLVLKIYHATEDYFSSDSYLTTPVNQIQALNKVLKQCQLLICVSEGVAESYQQRSAFNGKSITICNGCDYSFYAPASLDLILNHHSQANLIAFYQGNIFDKLDYALLIKLAHQMPTWQFQFCGRVLYNEKGWKQLLRLPNVQYLGVLTPEQVRQQSYQATVGLIPFVESEFLIKRAFPLKAFEYLACGLPVVSIPLRSLLPYEDVMQFASGVVEFERKMLQAKQLRHDKAHLIMRLKAASEQDYDDKVDTVLRLIWEWFRQPQSKYSALKLKEYTSCQAETPYFSQSHFIDLISRCYDRFPHGLKENIPSVIKRCFIKRWLS